MNLPLNNLQIKFLAEILEPYRNSHDRHVRNLVLKMDWLVKQYARFENEALELIAAMNAGESPPNTIVCTRESIFGKEQSNG